METTSTRDGQSAGARGLDEWVRLSQSLAARFSERAAAHDHEGSFPFENFEELKDAGFMRLTVPTAFGGYEASIETYLRVQEELARGDGSTALAFMMHAKLFGQQRDGPAYPERWFTEFCRGAVEHGWTCNTVATEEGLGSPAGGGLPDTVAVERDGGWVIDGRKTFTTMAPLLHYFIVLARVDGAVGDPPDLANFVVYRDDPGVRIEDTWNSLGMRATGSHDMVLEQVRLPAERLATRRTVGSADARGAAGTAWFALGVSATTIGVAQAALDYAAAFARERTPNSQRTIMEYPGVRSRIGHAQLLLIRSRAMVFDAARAWEQRADGQARTDVTDRIVAAKADTLNNCIEAVDLCMRVVGGVSLQKRRPIERYYRDVRAGLHNPPIEDRAIEQLARSVLAEPREPTRAAE
ncbi:MAG: acyl-CoA dehydrogenase family protein [Dehalococcoidia bacterium]